MNVMSGQTEDGDLNEIRSDDGRARSNACWRCDEVGHFHRNGRKLSAQAQSGDNMDTVIAQMTLTLKS